MPTQFQICWQNLRIHSATKTTLLKRNMLQVNLLKVIFLRNDAYYCYMKLVAFFKGYSVDKFWGIFEIIIFCSALLMLYLT